MKKILFFTGLVLSITCILFTNTNGQQLPSEMYLSTDGHMMFTGGKSPSGLYDSALIRRIDLQFSQADYWNLLKQNYQSQTEIPATMTVEGVVYDSVGVRFKGETSYTQLPQGSEKMSFNISVNFVHEDQRIMGYKTLNLHNCFQDPSFLREVFYLHQNRNNIPGARAAFIELYINGESWGLYPSIQQMNKDFLEEWFLSNDGANWRADAPTSGAPGPGPGPGGWGDGTAGLNYLGSDTTLYQQYYTLKSSDTENPWQKLVDACYYLNTTSSVNMTTVVPQYIDVDRALWFLASEIAFGDDDSYVYKGKMDYYAYYEPETGRLTPLEYDGNSAMVNSNINWSPFMNQSNVNYPLLNKLLAVPEYRQRYLAHLRSIIANQFDVTKTSAMFDNYQSQIELYVQNDPKKLYTYTAFVNEINTLKNFISTRRNNLLSNSEVAQTGPVITNVAFYDETGIAWSAPQNMKETTVRATVTHPEGLSSVKLLYSDKITGNFTTVLMYDDGAHNDLTSGDGIFGGSLPARTSGTWMRFYIEATAATTAKSITYNPSGAEHNVYIYQVEGGSFTPGTLVINEIMADNSMTASDEAGEFDDWFELFNGGTETINLSGYFLTDDETNPAKWEIPDGITIEPNGYLIFWADEDEGQGLTHTNFKLSKGGEVIILTDDEGSTVDSVAFGVQTTDMGYARVPNGTGNFVIQTATFNASNSPTGINSQETERESVSIYPNPVNLKLTVEVPESMIGQELQIYNSTGQCILKQVAGRQQQIDFSQRPAGFWLIRVGNHTFRILSTR